MEHSVSDSSRHRIPFVLIWLGTTVLLKFLHPDTNTSIMCIAWFVALVLALPVSLPFQATYMIFSLSEDKEKATLDEEKVDINSRILLMVFYIVTFLVGFLLGLVMFPKMEIGNCLTVGVLFPILGVPVLAGLAALISYIKRSIGR